MNRSWIALALLALAVALSSCGGGGDSEKKADSSSTQTNAENQDKPPGKLRPPNEAKGAKQEAAEKKEEKRDLEALKKEDRKFDESFKESSFERLVGKLPIQKPPLYVAQYISGDGHKLYTAVERKRFCKMSAAEKKKAVESFFETADASFRRGNVKDFEQVVTPLSDTIDKLPALATARQGTVTLTSLGRSC